MVSLVCALPVPVLGQACFLAGPESLLCQPGGQKETSRQLRPEKALSHVWGTLSDGRIVATLQMAHDHDPEDDRNEGHSHESAGPLVLLKSDGSLGETLITSDVLRAFPAPAGDAVAAITPERDLYIWRAPGAQNLIRAELPGRASHAAWSPDGKRLAAVVYPPDFSPAAMDNPGTVENFLRLQNSDIYLIDADSGKVLSQLTSDAGTDYNPFFSPDGTHLYYIWLDELEDEGGMMKLALDLDNGTSATAPAAQLSKAGEESGEVPLGRVGTYQFTRSGEWLLFEPGLPDGSGEIWSMKSDGQRAAFITKGRKPQRLSDGSFAVLTPEKSLKVLTEQEVIR